MARGAAGFPSKVEVEAHVVTLRNAALPDDRGILNPLIGKWLDGWARPRPAGLASRHPAALPASVQKTRGVGVPAECQGAILAGGL